MKRRDIFKGVIAGAAVTAHAQQAASGSHGSTKQAPAPVENSSRKRLLFDAHQDETVNILSDLIIPATDTPGASQARVNEYIDLILYDGPPSRRDAFLQGLGWLDGLSIREQGKPFNACSRNQQVAFLKRLDGSQDESLRTGVDFLRAAKRLTIEGYYTSRIGIEELNKGGRVPASFACTQDGGR